MFEDYLKRKEDNENKIFIFKSGNFYIFLGEDAEIMSKELGLKLTKFSNQSNKCGFPVKELAKYTKFIKLMNYDYEVILKPVDFVINDINEINIEVLSADDALDKIKKYRRILSNE